jgi:hypothetical protein
MAINDEIYDVLNAQHGFAPDPADDTTATYKVMVPGKIWLYFGRGDENEGPWIGFWIEDSVNSVLRENLGVILHNELSLDAGEVLDEGVYVYRTLNLTSVSASVIINSVVDAFKELERQTKRLIEQMI